MAIAPRRKTVDRFEKPEGELEMQDIARALSGRLQGGGTMIAEPYGKNYAQIRQQYTAPTPQPVAANVAQTGPSASMAPVYEGLRQKLTEQVQGDYWGEREMERAGYEDMAYKLWTMLGGGTAAFAPAGMNPELANKKSIDEQGNTRVNVSSRSSKSIGNAANTQLENVKRIIANPDWYTPEQAAEAKAAADRLGL